MADGFDRGEIPMIPRPCILLKCAMFAKQNKNDSDKAVNPKFRIAGVFEGRGGLGIVSVCEYVLHCFLGCCHFTDHHKPDLVHACRNMS